MAVQFQTSKALAALPLTPLIDIVFLLLIFFLVATRFADEDREMDVQLPAASQAQALILETQELFLHIDEQERVFLENKHIPTDDLPAELREVRRHRTALKTVILRADRRCKWDTVATVVNICHAVGLHDIRPTTTGEDSP